MPMKCGERLHGFVLERIVPVDELSMVIYQMRFEKNGARLAWLKRQDENQTFLMGFRTLPEDDTGVFHILEHSILDGSEHYPIKAPLIELIKRSLQTDLNAMTSTDMTGYYCCSRNKKDFLNLLDVYLDSIFHPLCIRHPASFLQEGWHYELDDEGNLDVNGVVYNEMKESASSWRFLMERSLDRQLFSDTCYQYVSGGVPEEMPGLSFEQYVRTYEKWYHPSNAWIVLDGQVDLPEVLAHLEAVLSEFDERGDFPELCVQQPHPATESVEYYEISPEEEGENRAILGREWIFGDWSEKEKLSAYCLLRDVLFGSNDAPIPKALYDRGLCQNVSLRVDSACYQSTVSLCIKHADPEKKEEIWKVVYDTLDQIIRDGINKDYLDACINTYDFNWREQSSGERSRGVVYGMSVMESWMYGGVPEWNLLMAEVLTSLRAKLNTNWFEELLRQTMLENPCYASVTLLPSTELGEEKEAAWERRMETTLASWDQSTIRQVEQTARELLLRQEEEVSEEQLAYLPRLSLQDIPAREAPTPNEISEKQGVTILHQDLPTNGIAYLKLYFECSDLSLNEMLTLDFFSEMYGNLPTTQSEPMELRRKMDTCLGSLEISVELHRKKRSRTRSEFYLVTELSFLEEKGDQALSLLGEILFETSFAELDKTARRLSQRRRNKEMGLLHSGSGLAMSLAERHLSTYNDMENACEGLRFLHWLQETDDSFGEHGQEILQTFEALMKKILCRSRMTLSLTGKRKEEWLDQVLALFPEGSGCESYEAPLRENCWEAYEINTDVSATAMVLDLTRVPGFAAEKYMGAAQVAAQILTYEYLWNEVREKSGAYDVGAVSFLDGTLHLSSSRDPNPSHTISVFAGCGAALKSFAEKNLSLDDYIISVLGERQSESDPRYDGLNVDANYLCQVDESEEAMEREQILKTSHRDLLELAGYLTKAVESSAVCVLGPKRQAELFARKWLGSGQALISILDGYEQEAL